MYGKNEDEKDIIERLHYRKTEEGFDYCFDGYSKWNEVEDEKFQKLKAKYILAKNELDNYINELHNSLE